MKHVPIAGTWTGIFIILTYNKNKNFTWKTHVPEQYAEPSGRCTICDLDRMTLDRMCKTGIMRLNLGIVYDILLAAYSSPLEGVKPYRLKSKRSAIVDDRVVFAHKCPTTPPLYLTSGKSRRSLVILMKRNRDSRRIHRIIRRRNRPPSIHQLRRPSINLDYPQIDMKIPKKDSFNLKKKSY